MENRMSLIVYSGTVDKLMAVATLATGGAAMGMDVNIFLTFWGLEAFRKGAYLQNTKISKDFEEFGPAAMEAMAAKKVPNWLDTLKGAKEIGTVKVVAPAVRHSETPATIRRPAPLVGQHTREILREFGYADDQVDAWLASGAAYSDTLPE